MRRESCICFLLICLPVAACGSRETSLAVVNIRADTNRNGTVDLDDPTEELNKTTWDKDHGAVFLANIDDDEFACPKIGTDITLPMCNDAADEVVNGVYDLLDLARLKTKPWPKAPKDVVGTLSISEAASSRVRLFIDRDGTFVVFHPEIDALDSNQIRQGVELAIEGKDIVRDSAAWDGFADVTLRVTSSVLSGPVSDTVRLRMAPVITRHHLDQPEMVYAASYADDPDSVVFVNGMKSAMSAALIAQPLVELEVEDQWVQDHFETAYMAMPATGGMHVIHVNVRSANVWDPLDKDNPLRSSGKIVFTQFRGRDVAGVSQFDVNHDRRMDTLNSFGNLETIPPYSLDGKVYPLGRIIRGSTANHHPDNTVLTMFESQKVQPALYVDTAWLFVGHIDETVTFLRAGIPRGWVIAVADPALAKTLLEQQQAAGNGSIKMFAGMYILAGMQAERTISEVLSDIDIMSMSARAAVEIDNQIQVLKQETGITDAEILRIPTLFWKVGNAAVAYQVGTVNGISLGDAHFGSPSPHGPVIGGRDIFEVQLEQEFAKLGVTVHWIEDWNLYHCLGGEVHCGSNTTRQVPANVRWWESGL